MSLDMAEVMKWLLVSLFALNVLVVVSEIGNERMRYTPGMAVRLTVFVALLIVGIVRYL